MLEQIKSSKLKVRWNLRELFKVTEWKDGCVYRTRSLGFIVCESDYFNDLRPEYMLCPVSTKVTKLING